MELEDLMQESIDLMENDFYKQKFYFSYSSLNKLMWNPVVFHQLYVLKIKEDISTGQQLGFSMRQSGLFPSMALQMVAIGEESGALDAMLDKVATHFENEVDNAVDGLTSMMEPLIMAVLGVLIGGLVIAMYLPIFQLGSVV